MSDDIHKLALDVRERLRFYAELGVEGLNVKLSERSEERPVILAARPSPARTAPPPIAVPAAPAEPKPAPGSRLSSLPSLSKRPVAPKRGSAEPPAAKAAIERPAEPIVVRSSPSLAATAETIEDIRSEIGNCVRCPLHAGRTQIVHSAGDMRARLMFVGEAPGADEDAAGLPFVGRAGKLLTDIIKGMGFDRDDVFIGNINRCRPPGNRQPIPLETETCRPFLLREIAVVQPKVIVVLGNTATQNLLDIKTPISKIRGQFQEYFGVKVMPTFHPAYLLRDPHKKRDVWEDMKKVRDQINSES